MTNFLIFYSLIVLSLTSFFSCSIRAQNPKALLLPVTKDSLTNQYIVEIKQRTPTVPIKLTLDLGGQDLWVKCDESYVSSSYKPILCDSAQCSLSGPNACLETCSGPLRPGCTNNTCSLTPDNTVKGLATVGTLGSDFLSIQTTNGENPENFVNVPRFMLACGTFLNDLAKGVKGMAGLGRTNISIPTQFSSVFNFPRKFALCLTRSRRSQTPGFVIFGDGPSKLLPEIDVSRDVELTYTKLFINPVSTASTYSEGDKSSEYFIGVESIRVTGKALRFNTSLLTITKEGCGGTKISTVDPYTVLETSIFKALIKSFGTALPGVPQVKPVKPFGLCFNSTFLYKTVFVGYAAPSIILMLQDKAEWIIFGTNSLVDVKYDVACLGFVDGGLNPRTSIVIGGYQLEDNLLQFDLVASRLGFSSPPLIFESTDCASFNFTSA
ncbi:hypothetical protein ACFE04_012516 [Oxalis oulophora]